MKISERNGELTMQDFPVTNWAMGFVLFLCSSILASLLIGKHSHSLPSVFILLVNILLFYWAYKKLSSPIIYTRVKPLEQTIEIAHIKLGLFKKMWRFDFSEIKHFEMVRRKPDRAYLYFNVMTLTDDSQIDLESSGQATSKICGISNKLNKLTRKTYTSA